MTKQTPLLVELDSRSYDIHIGGGLLGNAGDLISPVLAQQRTVTVTDENVAPLHLATYEASLARAGIENESIVLPAGEQTKVFRYLEDLLGAFLRSGIERRTTVVALGGGVIGDLTGFAASIVLRGVPFVQIPTTLLAQVDSSVGGKTAIDTPYGKNLVGAFYQPRLVIADIDVLDTLPHREVMAGYAEVVKYGLIRDLPFYQWLEENGPALCAGDKDIRQHAVYESCAAKADVVARDEREAGERALLNFGHTFGHALEAEAGFGDQLLHGEAVALGMRLAFDLSVMLDLCPIEDANRVRDHYRAVGLPADLPALQGVSWATDALIGHMAKDKKVRDGAITFILARGIGDAFIADNVDPDRVRQVMDAAIGA